MSASEDDYLSVNTALLMQYRQAAIKANMAGHIEVRHSRYPVCNKAEAALERAAGRARFQRALSYVFNAGAVAFSGLTLLPGQENSDQILLGGVCCIFASAAAYCSGRESAKKASALSAKGHSPKEWAEIAENARKDMLAPCDPYDLDSNLIWRFAVIQSQANDENALHGDNICII